MTDIVGAALKSNAWPFAEAKKIIKRIKGQTPAKGYVLFQSGYGPSGLPHIGTFGENARTSMVIHAFKILTENKIPTKLICFSDDMDGLRKVPSNVPNQELLQQNLNLPLTKVPDPYGKFNSFGEHNNNMLKEFLDQFGFEYELYSATEQYKSGRFNETLTKVAENYDKIMKIMLPSLGEERQATYSPFLPISPTTGEVLQVPMQEVDAKAGTITFTDADGQSKTVSIFDGNVKLQWKVDWAMRWAALDVDYEMHGKDLIDSYTLGAKICRVLGGEPPQNLAYELFLDEEGSKISKSKGNGLTMDEWLRYGPEESLAYYMFLKPTTAKRLYFDVIPKHVDEWVSQVEAYHQQSDLTKQMNNPVWHTYNGDVPQISLPVSFSMLLNLASVVHAQDKDILWGFIKTYDSSLNAQNNPLLDRLCQHAVLYYKDRIKPTITYRMPTDAEKKALISLLEKLNTADEQTQGSELQNMVYATGKEFEYENLRDWFKALYEILLGQSQGPRMGSFFALYGLENSKNLIARIIKGEDLNKGV
ncbi:MAG: lysine--tRNA ligase [Alphaproteobacteria bacterium]